MLRHMGALSHAPTVEEIAGSAAASRVARASAAEAAFAGSRFTTVTVCQVMNGAFFRSTTGVV